MTADTIARALRDVAPDGMVEVDGGLAVLRVRDPALLADAGRRARALAVAAAHGVTHLALELVDDDAPAPALPRD